MSLLGKLMDSMRLNDGDEDDYFLDDEGYDDDKPTRKGLPDKKDEDFYEDGDEEDGPAKPRFLSRSKVVPMKQRTGVEVSMMKPAFTEDAEEICDYLLAGKTVAFNMEGLHMKMAQKIVDFTSGATYSMNGSLQKISSYIFITTPESVGLSGDFRDLFGGGSLGVSGMNLRI